MTKLNVRNINIVADFIEEGDPNLGFNMGYWGEKWTKEDGRGFCGTTACIAGWTVFTFNPALFFKYLEDDFDMDISFIAGHYLGLSDQQEIDLFTTNRIQVPHQAAKILRHLAKTGGIDYGILVNPKLPDELTDVLKIPSDNKELVNQE